MQKKKSQTMNPPRKDDLRLTEQEQVHQSALLIRSHFGLGEDSPIAECDSMAGLEVLLAQVINHLLDRDFQALLNIFYRLDISELKLKQILSSTDLSAMGTSLAQEVIARELKKVLTRQKYKERE